MSSLYEGSIMSKIIISPSRYVQGPGEIQNLASHVKKMQKQSAYLLVDAFILEHYQEQITAGFHSEHVKYTVETFQGECTEDAVHAYAGKALEHGCDIVIAIGGGKALDTGKACAHFSNLPVIVAPTVASTDAPCSAISVLYKENGEMAHYLYLKSNPDIVLVDSNIILHAPARLLAAGMGDALSTYFESKACFDSGAANKAGGKVTGAALALAKLCLDILLQDGTNAYRDCLAKKLSPAFENVVEANTYLSGIGFESGGLAAAHAIHNGFSLLPETSSFLHGEKVAFATIVQLVLEKRETSEIRTILSFCKSVGLPTCLKDFNLNGISGERLYQAALAATDEKESMQNMPFAVHAEDVVSAIFTADELSNSF